MRHAKRLGIAMGVLFLIGWVVSAWAAEQQLTLKAEKDGMGASGMVIIKEAGAGKSKITINLKGLKPGGVYTAWLVNMKPKMDMAGIGQAPYVLKVDPSGSSSYAATVSSDTLAKWQMIEIALHHSGNPEDMKNMGAALSVNLK